MTRLFNGVKKNLIYNRGRNWVTSRLNKSIQLKSMSRAKAQRRQEGHKKSRAIKDYP